MEAKIIFKIYQPFSILIRCPHTIITQQVLTKTYMKMKIITYINIQIL